MLPNIILVRTGVMKSYVCFIAVVLQLHLKYSGCKNTFKLKGHVEKQACGQESQLGEG